MYLPRFDPWEIYLALYLYYFVDLFRYKEFKMALINLDLHSITLFWQLKFWAGFCELLGWKSSIQSGNTDARLTTTTGTSAHDLN